MQFCRTAAQTFSIARESSAPDNRGAEGAKIAVTPWEEVYKEEVEENLDKDIGGRKKVVYDALTAADNMIKEEPVQLVC